MAPLPDRRGDEPSEGIDSVGEFERAGQASERGIVAELVAFMAETRSWWMGPLLVVFGLLGVLLVLGATGVAPFIYVFW